MLSDLGLGAPMIIAVLFCWFIILIYSRLIKVLIYVVTSSHERLKRLIRPIVYAVIGVVALAIIYVLNAGSPTDDKLIAITELFCAEGTDMIPFFGWLKGIIPAIYRGNWLEAIIFALLLIALAALIAIITFRIRVDFYEDAMGSAAEREEKLNQAKEAANGAVITRKKERKSKFSERVFSTGSGAKVFFTKAMHNRFRFAHLGIFTKTMETYILTALAICVLIKFVIGEGSFIAIALVLTAMTFFRALGNPIEEDSERNFFLMIPESPWSKYAYSMLGGVTNCALDLLPAFIIGGIFLRADPIFLILSFLLSMSMYLYSACTGAFISLSIPVNLSQMIRGVIQIMFVYFGILPSAVPLIIGLITGHMTLFTLIAIAINLALSILFIIITPTMFVNGRK